MKLICGLVIGLVLGSGLSVFAMDYLDQLRQREGLDYQRQQAEALQWLQLQQAQQYQEQRRRQLQEDRNLQWQQENPWLGHVPCE